LKARSADRIVLLVDDDTAVRQMLARALAFEAFVVVEAANGLEALEQLRQGCGAGVIVLDLRMPVMDGWAFRRAQRADPKIAKTPVVILSGADAHRFAELDRKSSRRGCGGADDHLTPPHRATEIRRSR